MYHYVEFSFISQNIELTQLVSVGADCFSYTSSYY